MKRILLITAIVLVLSMAFSAVSFAAPETLALDVAGNASGLLTVTNPANAVLSSYDKNHNISGYAADAAFSVQPVRAAGSRTKPAAFQIFQTQHSRFKKAGQETRPQMYDNSAYRRMLAVLPSASFFFAASISSSQVRC